MGTMVVSHGKNKVKANAGIRSPTSAIDNEGKDLAMLLLRAATISVGDTGTSREIPIQGNALNQVAPRSRPSTFEKLGCFLSASHIWIVGDLLIGSSIDIERS